MPAQLRTSGGHLSGRPNLTSLERAMTPQSPMHCPVLPDFSDMLKSLCINLIYPRPSFINLRPVLYSVRSPLQPRPLRPCAIQYTRRQELSRLKAEPGLWVDSIVFLDLTHHPSARSPPRPSPRRPCAPAARWPPAACTVCRRFSSAASARSPLPVPPPLPPPLTLASALAPGSLLPPRPLHLRPAPMSHSLCARPVQAHES